jgi:hypothetical protein
VAYGCIGPCAQDPEPEVLKSRTEAQFVAAERTRPICSVAPKDASTLHAP